MAGVTGRTEGPPVNAVTPVVLGPPLMNEVLTAYHGFFTGSQPLTSAFQWIRCDVAEVSCTDIAGATGQTYKVANEDIGSKLRVRVTATNVRGGATAVSPPTQVVQEDVIGDPTTVGVPDSVTEEDPAADQDGEEDVSDPITGELIADIEEAIGSIEAVASRRCGRISQYRVRYVCNSIRANHQFFNARYSNKTYNEIEGFGLGAITEVGVFLIKKNSAKRTYSSNGVGFAARSSPRRARWAFCWNRSNNNIRARCDYKTRL